MYHTSAKGDGSTDDTAAIQADVNARRLVVFPPGVYKITSAISVPAGTHIQGGGKWSTTVVRAGANQSYFVLADSCSMDGIGTNQPGFNSQGLRAQAGNVTATSGSVISVTGQFVRLTNVRIGYAYDGIVANDASANWHIHMDQIDVRGYEHRALSLTGGDHFISNFKFWQGGSTIGSTEADTNNGVGIYLHDFMEAFVAVNGDIMGGLRGMETTAATYATGQRPAYSRLTNVFFDSSTEGVILDRLVEFDFTGCWFSNRPGNGVTVKQASGIRFTGGGAINSAQHGVQVQATAKRVSFNGFAASGNSTAGSGTYDGLRFDAGATDFEVQGGTFGNADLGFGTQGYGIRIASGGSDRYIVRPGLTGSGNSTGKVFDGGSGTNKTVEQGF